MTKPKRIKIQMHKVVCVKCLTIWQTSKKDTKVCPSCVNDPSTILTRRLANIVKL
jgi:rRNA maturation endonuclease Nob1